MAHFKLLLSILIFSFAVGVSGQDKPSINYNDLIISTEQNVQLITAARELAAQQHIPYSIYLPQGIFIEARSIENGKVVYSIINDLKNIYNNGDVAFWEDIQKNYDLSNARIQRAYSPTQNPGLGFQVTEQRTRAVSFLMVLESTTDALMTFNSDDGSLINPSYFPGGDPNLSTPIEALLTPNATIIISDQITDQIVEYDTLGNFSRILFGNDLTVLDNCRGIELRPGASSVVATIGSGTNQSAVPEFDLASGNFLGNFIPPNAAQMTSPFDIIFRASDCLVAGQGSNNIVQYDLSGNYIGNFVASITFPEQIYEAPSGNILAAGFSTPSGLYIYDSNGNQVNYFNSVTGIRGVHQLGNGNYLVTSGSGVYVLDQTTGAVISQPVSGVSARFITEFDRQIIPVELISFSAAANNGNVTLNWATATETNNKGFEVQKSNGSEFQTIGFVQGNGTSTQQHSYSYTDNNVAQGNYSYRLRQVDFDGTSEYSPVVEVNVNTPAVFNLAQNYPNPFNPSTKINYSLKVDSKVTLQVFDILGQKVATLLNENIAAGNHNVTFDASKINSGVYLYRIEATGADGSNFTSVKKMILTK